MSFTYTTGIPAAGNNPSSDQPNMQTNTNSIASIWGVDHYTFGSGLDGKHKQITFAGNNPPTLPATPPVLFTNTVDGAGNTLPGSLAELFFYSGTAPQSSSQFVSQTTGSVLLFGGIILKWGVINFSGSSVSVTFVSAFPNNLFAACITGSNSTVPAANGILTYSGGSRTGFTAYQNGGSANTANYIAIGN